MNEKNEKLIGVHVVSEGLTKNDGLHIDAQFLQKIIDIGNKKGDSIRVRFGHPSIFYAHMGTQIGYINNFRLNDTGNIVLGDLIFIETEFNQKMIDHVRKIAEKNPALLGMSIEFEPESEYGMEKIITVDGKRYATISDLKAVDVVDVPAANEKFWSVNTNFIDTMSEKIINKISSLLKINEKKQRKFGEVITDDDIIFQFEGDVLVVGIAVFLFDGTPVPDGEYTLTTGEMILVQSGIVTAIALPEAAAGMPESEEMGEQNEDTKNTQMGTQNNDLLEKIVSLLEIQQNKIAEIEKQQMGTQRKFDNLQPATQPVTVPQADARQFNINSGHAKKMDNIFDGAQKFLQFANRRIKPENRGKSDRQLGLEIGKPTRKFEGGWDISETLSRCIPYWDEIFRDNIRVDGILSRATDVSGEIPMGRSNMYHVHMPQMNFMPAAGALSLDCNPDCTFLPASETKLNQRTLEVYQLRFDHEICAEVVRNAFNGMIYIDQENIPAESIVLANIADYLKREMEHIFWFGRTGTGCAIKGIIQELKDAQTAGCIPAAQVKTWIAINATNAVTEVQTIVSPDYIPGHMWNDNNVLITTPKVEWNFNLNLQNVYQFLYTNWQGLGNVAGTPGIPGVSNNVGWDASNWNLADYGAPLYPGEDFMLVTQYQNLYWAFQEQYGTPEGGLDVWFSKDDGTIKMKFRGYFGVNFGQCDKVVFSVKP